jgi:hypothetical protein
VTVAELFTGKEPSMGSAFIAAPPMAPLRRNAMHYALMKS